jgi:vancomycin resistance protein YoaR
MILRDDKFNLQFALDSATLSKLLVSTKPTKLDENGLRAIVTEWAAQVGVPARDARLDFDPDTGEVTVIQPSQSGRKLDIDATVAGIHQAMNAGQNQAALVMVDDMPAVDMNNIANMGIRELVASGVSYFRGSPAERVQNIVVGASKLNGVVIPPGAIFSFNKYVEDVTGANGFADALIIWGDQTATGAGGGICQVSTTVFRAAFTGGLPIVERYNHGYVVGWYGDPGLDATIFTPSVDFRFSNDTGAYLLLKPLVDSVNSVITINLYGTKPNRQVTIKPAVQSDVQEPEPPQYKVDNSLAKGQMTQVESAHKGLSVSVERVIVENGTTRTDSVVSKYQPWRAVYLVGPGTEVPAQATAVPTPATAVTTTTSITP